MRLLNGKRATTKKCRRCANQVAILIHQVEVICFTQNCGNHNIGVGLIKGGISNGLQKKAVEIVENAKASNSEDVYDVLCTEFEAALIEASHSQEWPSENHIQNAAIEDMDNFNRSRDGYSGFISGAKWAIEWIRGKK